jgi:putative transcriptional regulator
MPGQPLSASLLVASPTLTDPHFSRTVVRILDHSDAGAVGVILNRPTGAEVDEVLPGWGQLATGPGVLFSGGPVSPDAAICLALLNGEPIGPARALDGPLAVVDLDGEADRVAGRARALRVFAGYAGWGAGQLEAEIEEGSWFVVDALPLDPFAPDPAHLWTTVLRRQPGPLRFLSTYPPDVTLN